MKNILIIDDNPNDPFANNINKIIEEMTVINDRDKVLTLLSLDQLYYDLLILDLNLDDFNVDKDNNKQPYIKKIVTLDIAKKFIDSGIEVIIASNTEPRENGIVEDIFDEYQELKVVKFFNKVDVDEITDYIKSLEKSITTIKNIISNPNKKEKYNEKRIKENYKFYQGKSIKLSCTNKGIGLYIQNAYSKKSKEKRDKFILILNNQNLVKIKQNNINIFDNNLVLKEEKIKQVLFYRIFDVKFIYEMSKLEEKKITIDKIFKSYDEIIKKIKFEDNQVKKLLKNNYKINQIYNIFEYFGHIKKFISFVSIIEVDESIIEYKRELEEHIQKSEEDEKKRLEQELKNESKLIKDISAPFIEKIQLLIDAINGVKDSVSLESSIETRNIVSYIDSTLENKTDLSLLSSKPKKEVPKIDLTHVLYEYKHDYTKSLEYNISEYSAKIFRNIERLIDNSIVPIPRSINMYRQEIEKLNEKIEELIKKEK